MRTSERARQILKAAEGFSPNAYREPNGSWSIGYGHNGPDVHANETVTEAEAEALLDADLGRFEAGVDRLVEVSLTQGQFDGLVLFAYNLGLGALSKSTLLRKVNEGDPTAAVEFDRWVFAGGRRLPGLVTRRAAERSLFEETA